MLDQNRLVSATVTKGGNTATTNYSYDAQSRRTAKQLVGGTSVLHLYDGWNMIAEYTGTTLSKTYAWGMDIGSVGSSLRGDRFQAAGGVGYHTKVSYKGTDLL